MELKTISIILLILLAVSVCYNVFQQETIEQYDELVNGWCGYSNDLIEVINYNIIIHKYDTDTLDYNKCMS